MDFAIGHWAPFPRRFPSAFPVVTAQFSHDKREWVRNAFATCDFSLILRGRGEFIRFGQTWEVQAPCVITQWPGEYVEYGPLPGETWEEFYIVYDASLMPKFEQCGLIDVERPVWPIADWAKVSEHLSEMDVLANVAVPERVVDRVDRVCEQIILATWLPPHHAAEGGPEMNTLLAEVRRDLSRPIVLEEEASRLGMSISTFRRRWAAISAVPPARYLQQLRIREACRLLAETDRPIYEIAAEVGFPDEFYFSRRFRQETHFSPREYRKTYQTRRVG